MCLKSESISDMVEMVVCLNKLKSEGVWYLCLKSFFKNDANEKKGTNVPKTGTNVQKVETVS